MSESDALACALDQTGNVRNDETAIAVDLDEPKEGRHCRKGIGRDLRPRLSEATEQRALTCVRHADKSDVGDHAQFKANASRFSLFSRTCHRRRTQSRGLETYVALAAEPALSDDEFRAVLLKILEE